MIDPAVLGDALAGLAGPGMPVDRAQRDVPAVRGLYAFHADAGAWRALGLGDPPDAWPLYVGKAERSLAARDVRTHFATGKTGSSTLRRSLAGLLVDTLDLRARSRNPDRPGAFSGFGLEPAGDARLSDWMVRHVRLAVWPAPARAVLGDVESAALAHLRPPLNLDRASTAWRTVVRAGRARLAQQARAAAARPGGDETPRTRRALGVDAAGAHGWIGVVVDEHGFAGARLGDLRAVIGWAEPVAAIGVDIPIGHVPAGARRADADARRFVGPRASSVFAAPPAAALAAASYDEVNAALRAGGAPRMTRQAWALIPKITEAAGVAAADARVHEVHPEVSFRALAGGDLPWSKKSWNGLQHRRRLLAGAGIVVPHEVPDAGAAAADDVVDAAAAAWSAMRIAAGTARSLPDPPEPGDGRAVAIWY